MTKLVSFGLGLVSTFLVARLLGPSGRGEFYLLTLVPTTLLTLGQFGIPSALVFFTGRGSSLRDVVRACKLVIPVLALITVVPAALLSGNLLRTLLAGVSDQDLYLVLAVTPFLFASMLGSAVLLGRQAIGTINLLSVSQTLGSLALIGALVGVAGYGVHGAVGAYAAVAVIASVATMILIRRLAPSAPDAPRLSLRALTGYGMRIYPGSLATFFSYRVDVFLLSAMLGSPAQVGLYSLAVGLAELVFYVPDSVAMAFFPRVAASTRESADEMAPAIARQTVLMTSAAAITMLPITWLAIHFLLPAFTDSYIPLLILLPGVVSLSVSKVLSGYVSGLGRPLPAGGVAVTSLVVNVVANLLLIPRFGIAGAAAASLVSYSLNAGMMIVISSRLAGTSPRSLVVPRRRDLVAVIAVTRILTRDAASAIDQFRRSA